MAEGREWPVRLSSCRRSRGGRSRRPKSGPAPVRGGVRRRRFERHQFAAGAVHVDGQREARAEGAVVVRNVGSLLRRVNCPTSRMADRGWGMARRVATLSPRPEPLGVFGGALVVSCGSRIADPCRYLLRVCGRLDTLRFAAHSGNPTGRRCASIRSVTSQGHPYARFYHALATGNARIGEAAARGLQQRHVAESKADGRSRGMPTRPGDAPEGSPAWGTVRHSSSSYNGQVSPSRLQEVLHAVPSATRIVFAAY